MRINVQFSSSRNDRGSWEFRVNARMERVFLRDERGMKLNALLDEVLNTDVRLP